MKKASLTVVAVLAVAAVAQPGPERARRIVDAGESQILYKIDTYFHAGLHEETTSLLRAMRGRYPADDDLSGQLVWMLGNLGRHDEAVAEAIAFRRANPLSLEAAITEAHIWSNQRLFAKIPPMLEPVLHLETGMGAFVLLARAYEEMGLIGEALRIYERRLERMPDDAATLRNIERLKKLIADG